MRCWAGPYSPTRPHETRTHQTRLYTDEEITERTAAWMALFDQWDAIQMETDGQVRGTG
jgi:hypothetical protein